MWSTLAWRRDADGVGAAGADGTACDGVQGFVEADLDRGEEIMAAADGEAVARDCRIGARKERTISAGGIDVCAVRLVSSDGIAME